MTGCPKCMKAPPVRLIRIALGFWCVRYLWQRQSPCRVELCRALAGDETVERRGAAPR